MSREITSFQKIKLPDTIDSSAKYNIIKSYLYDYKLYYSHPPSLYLIYDRVTKSKHFFRILALEGRAVLLSNLKPDTRIFFPLSRLSSLCI